MGRGGFREGAGRKAKAETLRLDLALAEAKNEALPTDARLTAALEAIALLSGSGINRSTFRQWRTYQGASEKRP